MRRTLSTSVSTSWASARPLEKVVEAKWQSLPEVPIALQALVTRAFPVDDGFVIQTLEPGWQRICEELKRNPDAMHQLTASQWEELIAASYDKAGYDEVILTPRSGDYGRDVIATKRGWGCVRIVDQVKAFKPGHLVSANDVRALIGVMVSDQRATKGVVSTTSAFAPRIETDPFIAPHVPYRLELIDGPQLLARLRDLNAKPSNAEKS